MPEASQELKIQIQMQPRFSRGLMFSFLSFSADIIVERSLPWIKDLEAPLERISERVEQKENR